MTVIDITTHDTDFEYVKERLGDYPFIRNDQDIAFVLEELYRVTKGKYELRFIQDIQFFAVAQRAVNKRK